VKPSRLLHDFIVREVFAKSEKCGPIEVRHYGSYSYDIIAWKPDAALIFRWMSRAYRVCSGLEHWGARVIDDEMLLASPGLLKRCGPVKDSYRE
jgi:hypothetical protein